MMAAHSTHTHIKDDILFSSHNYMAYKKDEIKEFGVNRLLEIVY